MMTVNTLRRYSILILDFYKGCVPAVGQRRPNEEYPAGQRKATGFCSTSKHRFIQVEIDEGKSTNKSSTGPELVMTKKSARSCRLRAD
jgi:hypothetical protein